MEHFPTLDTVDEWVKMIKTLTEKGWCIPVSKDEDKEQYLVISSWGTFNLLRAVRLKKMPSGLLNKDEWVCGWAYSDPQPFHIVSVASQNWQPVISPDTNINPDA